MMQALSMSQAQPIPRDGLTARRPPGPTSHVDPRAACAPLFARMAGAVELAEAERQTIAQAVVGVVTLTDGQPLHAGSSAHLHLVVDGWAFRAHNLVNGTRQITSFLIPGDLFDWARAAAYEEVRACGFARIACLRNTVAASEPSALRRYSEWAADIDGHLLRSRLASLGRLRARERVAHLLCELHHRLDRVGLARGGAFPCPLRQDQLADALGLTTVHINRVLQGLRQDGLVILKRPHVMIPDIARLHAECGFDDLPGMLEWQAGGLPGLHRSRVDS